MTAPQGKVYMVGIMLKSSACRAVLPLPLNEITDRIIEGSMLFPETKQLWQQLCDTSDFQHQCQLLMEWLMQILQPPAYSKLIREACGKISNYPISESMDYITHKSGVSTRHLRRLFKDQLGISPARYLRQSRFIKALHLMESPLSLTEIAHQTFYYDQAHFCRDFRDIAGMAPEEYRSKAGPVPGYIFYH